MGATLFQHFQGYMHLIGSPVQEGKYVSSYK